MSRRANQTMRVNAKRDGHRCARVPMGGETCTFCAMLASRGFVYRSAKLAGEGDHFHNNCRCKVIPGFDGMSVQGYDPNEWLERWRELDRLDGMSYAEDAIKAAKAMVSATKPSVGAFARIETKLMRGSAKSYATACLEKAKKIEPAVT